MSTHVRSSISRLIWVYILNGQLMWSGEAFISEGEVEEHLLVRVGLTMNTVSDNF